VRPACRRHSQQQTPRPRLTGQDRPAPHRAGTLSGIAVAFEQITSRIDARTPGASAFIRSERERVARSGSTPPASRPQAAAQVASAQTYRLAHQFFSSVTRLRSSACLVINRAFSSDRPVSGAGSLGTVSVRLRGSGSRANIVRGRRRTVRSRKLSIDACSSTILKRLRGRLRRVRLGVMVPNSCAPGLPARPSGLTRTAAGVSTVLRATFSRARHC